MMDDKTAYRIRWGEIDDEGPEYGSIWREGRVDEIVDRTVQLVGIFTRTLEDFPAWRAFEVKDTVIPHDPAGENFVPSDGTADRCAKAACTSGAPYSPDNVRRIRCHGIDAQLRPPGVQVVRYPHSAGLVTWRHVESLRDVCGSAGSHRYPVTNGLKWSQ